MPGGNTGNGFDKDPQRAVEAGKKSKRGKSIMTIIDKYLSKDAPETWVNDIKLNGLDIEDKDIETILAARHIIDAYEDKGLREKLLDRLFGKAKETVQQEHSGEIKFKWPEEDR